MNCVYVVRKPSSRTLWPAEFLQSCTRHRSEWLRSAFGNPSPGKGYDMHAFWHWATIMSRGEHRDLLIAEAIIVVRNSRDLHDIVKTKLGEPECRGLSCMMLLAATIGDLLPSEDIPLAFALPVEDCIGFVGAMVEGTDEICEYHRRLDEQAGASAVVVAEEKPNSGMLEWLQLALPVTEWTLHATIMLHCIGPAVPRLLGFPLHCLHSCLFV